MISTAVRQKVLHRLRVAETEPHAKVLLSIESGSRAWGFASSNSDYDARFIYANTPDWYLSGGLEELKSRLAAFAVLARHRKTPHCPPLSSTYQKNNMQKNRTSLWAGSAVARLKK